jgi:hypothetical protein
MWPGMGEVAFRAFGQVAVAAAAAKPFGGNAMGNSRRSDSLRCFALAFALSPFALGGAAAHAETISPSVLSYFPKNISELAYADLARTRQFPWFAQFRRQTLPAGFGDLEQFLSSAGIDPSRRIDELVWSLSAESEPSEVAPREVAPSRTQAKSDGVGKAAVNTPAEVRHNSPESEQLLAIALGDFDPEASEALLEKKNVATIDWHGHTLYACGAMRHNFYLVFLDSGTLAFGNPVLLQHMLEVSNGAEESVLSNQALFPLIRKINGSGIFWGALNDAGARAALTQLVPEAANFPDVARLIGKMQAMTISVDGDQQLEADLSVSAAPEAAVSLSQLMQAGLLYRQFQASQDDPQFAKILQNVSITVGGPGIQIRFEISSEQMVSLLQHNTFSAGL